MSITVKRIEALDELEKCVIAVQEFTVTEGEILDYYNPLDGEQLLAAVTEIGESSAGIVIKGNLYQWVGKGAELVRAGVPFAPGFLSMRRYTLPRDVRHAIHFDLISEGEVA